MDPICFVVTATSCAMAILLVVDLAVPFAPLRRWLLSGPHVQTQDPTSGPWFVVRDGEREPTPHPSPSAAAGHLSGPERARAWAAELVSCPWCTGAWVTAVATCGLALARGADVLVFWPSLWFASAAAVVVIRRVSL